MWTHTQWSWWFKQSNWFAVSDYSTIFSSYRGDNVWAWCFSHFFFFLENDVLKVDRILGLTFFKARKDFKDSKRRFSIYCSCVLCSMDCLQLPFIRVEGAVLWTHRFLTRNIWPKNRIIFMTKKFESKCLQNSTFQINRKKNATGRRCHTSSNRADIFVSSSWEERHNKPFWLWTWRVNRKQQSSTFLLR